MYKKLLTALLFTCLGGFVFAQETLTASTSNPLPGDAFININAYADGISPGDSGASMTWDFSSLDTMSIDTNVAAGCAYVFPTCDWAVGSNLAMSNESQNFTDYIYQDNTKLSDYGMYYSTTQYVVYSIPMDELRYPFTYLTTFTDNYAGYANYTLPVVGTPVLFNVTGSVFVDCDSWGTLVLPGNTYNSTLRVHSTQLYNDSSGSTGIIQFQLDTYTWYDTGIHTPLLSIGYTAQVGGGYVDTTVTFLSRPLRLDDQVPAISGMGASLKLYPDPVTDELNINFTVPSGTQVRISLVDVVGREVAVISDQYAQGIENIQYNTTSLPNGLYLVRLQSGSETVTRKIEIR